MAAPVAVVVLRDFDGKWVARWPPGLVATGDSAGAGRHETRSSLVAAIEAKGWDFAHHHGDVWYARRGGNDG